MVCSLLVIAGGIINFLSSNHTVHTGAAYIDGIAFGVAMVATIISGGEVSDNDIRGRVVTAESLGISTGIFIFLMFQSVHRNLYSSSASLNMMQLQGLLSIIFGVIAFSTSFLAADSPIHHIKRNDDKKALSSLQFFHKEDKPSTTSIKKLSEMKQLVREDRSRSWTENFFQGLLPFFKLGTLRALMTFSSNYPIVYAFVQSERIAHMLPHGLIFLGLSRWVATFITNTVLVEKLGRKLTLMVSVIAAGALFIALGYINHTEANLRNSELMIVGVWVSLTIQFFCGLGQGISAVYMSEAFSTSIKPLFIFLIITVENLSIVIMFESLEAKDSDSEPIVYSGFYYNLGGVFFTLFFIVWILFPETKGTSLRKAHHKFLDFFNLSFW